MMNLFPQKKYKIIYADPPWKFKTWSEKGKGRSAEKHYKTMELNDIKKLPLADISEDDCILFLWATSPMLQQAFEVMKAWGFSFQEVAFTWVKKNKKSPGFFSGMGYYTRSNAEFCLVGVKGHPKIINQDVSQLVVTIRREHSRKPDEVRERIVRLMGDLPRIELFARERFPGWDTWGDEVDSHVFQKAKRISIMNNSHKKHVRKKM